MSLESQLNRNYRRPEQHKAPLRRNQASRPQRQFVSAPERPKAPLRTNQQKSRPVVRPTRTTFNSRRQQAARNELFQRRLLALSMLSQGPAPSPDRTTGREKAGFASDAFTGKPIKFVDEANGFFPTVAAGRAVGYGSQAGNPKQQKVAKEMQARDLLHDVGKQLGGSPIGQVAGDVIANQTWAKIAPLLRRDPSKPPKTSFGQVGPMSAGFAKDGQVTVSPSMLDTLLTSEGRQSFKKLLAHEYAHTQQGPTADWRPSRIPGRHGSGFSPAKEGGAEAFKTAVAPLLGYRADTPRTARRTDDYGQAQIAFGNNLRKTLIGQFPRVARGQQGATANLRRRRAITQ